jgi:threonine dehydrogenase-like Zn-dependent dehydrogenase
VERYTLCQVHGTSVVRPGRVLGGASVIASGAIDSVIEVPDDIADADALFIPPLALALGIWRLADLELGEAAVYTGGHPLTPFVALAARWRGALPLVQVGGSEAADADSTLIGLNEATAADCLRELFAACPGVAAVDLSGQQQAAHLLLEALPRWGRLVLAAPFREPLTTDFYTDIHRKGTVVRGAADAPVAIFDDPARWRHDVESACRLLASRRVEDVRRRFLDPADSAIASQSAQFTAAAP